MEEVFKDMAGFEEYVEVSNYGRVYIKKENTYNRIGGMSEKREEFFLSYKMIRMGTDK